MLKLSSARARRSRSLSALALLLLLAMMLGTTACATGQPPLEDSEPFGTTPTSPESETNAAADTLPESTVDTSPAGDDLTFLTIENGPDITLALGETLLLTTNAPETYDSRLIWSASSDVVTVSSLGFVTTTRVGAAVVTVQYGNLTAMTIVTVTEPETAPESGESETAAPETITPETTAPETPPAETTQPETKPEPSKPRDPIPEELGSPAGYKPAASYEEALERTKKGEISGYLWLMDQEPNIADDRPMQNGKYIRNSEAHFIDDNTYVVVDSEGYEVFRVYRGGGYITLEEVAAYLYAFGDVPANYTTKKVTNVGTSIWGKYLRGNHSNFSGDTAKYPYEPELPRISGCGGDLQYYEIDIGTTGTDCAPNYSVRPYNDGSKITRGAARIVYARFDANGNKVIDPEEKYIFYTYNHYNDFREYLNYYGGWGEMFGNITGGGKLSSKYDCNPTDYVPVVLAPISQKARTAEILCADFDAWAYRKTYAA